MRSEVFDLSDAFARQVPLNLDIAYLPLLGRINGASLRERLWLLKNSTFLGNRQNFGDTKCLEIREDRL